MNNIKEQVEWERECARRGEAQYYATQDALKEKGRLEQCDGYNFVMKDRMLDIANRLRESIADPSAGYQSAYTGVLREVSTHVPFEMMAFFCTQVVLRAISNGKNRKSLHVTKVLATIGERIETEMKCRIFEAMNPSYYETIARSFKEHSVQDYTHKRNVVMTMFKDYDTKWKDWGPRGRIGVGAKILEAFLHVMQDLFFIDKVWESKKCTTKIMPTVAFDEWIAEFEQTKGLMQPALLPLKTKPLDWTAEGAGGYYTPRMQLATPFIKTKGKAHREFIERFTPHQHILAVNKLQQTSWRINKNILSVMQAVYKHDLGHGLPSANPIQPPSPPEFIGLVSKDQFDEAMTEEMMHWKAQAKQAYFEEAKRKGKVLTFMQTLRLAQELSEWDEYYYVYTCDFRGRIYCATSCLSPQGDEKARALMEFSKGLPLGQEGVMWLAIHGANCFGIKGSHEQRYIWTWKREEEIKAIVANPISNTEWTKADKPYQFLAFCYEWVAASCGRDMEYVSHLPVGIDGSCNGLQHFSAILRDPVGAEATNLTKGRIPKDIYGIVAEKTTCKLQRMEDTLSDLILKVGVDRSGTKRQTMTLPYGATKQACREYTFEWVVGKWEEFAVDKSHKWTIASYLSPVIWESIGETVQAAVIAMEWLQRNVGGRYVKWVSEVGFPVYQYYKEIKPIRINTKLAGKTRLSARDIDTAGKPNPAKQRLGIVPNFIHSVDASHLVLTVNRTNLPAYGMVHDEFVSHACNMTTLHRETKGAFHQLHKDRNQLTQWAKHQGISESKVPPQGTFDIDLVLEANNLFG